MNMINLCMNEDIMFTPFINLEYSRFKFLFSKILNLEYSRFSFFHAKMQNLEYSRFRFFFSKILNLEYSRFSINLKSGVIQILQLCFEKWNSGVLQYTISTGDLGLLCEQGKAARYLKLLYTTSTGDLGKGARYLKTPVHHLYRWSRAALWPGK